MLKIDGYDDAIIGQALIWQDKSRREVLVYSGEKIREIMMERDGMSAEEAVEYIEFNIEGAYVGPHTPVIMWPKEEWDEGWEEE